MSVKGGSTVYIYIWVGTLLHDTGTQLDIHKKCLSHIRPVCETNACQVCFLAPFLATVSGWLRHAAHGMFDITREPMRPHEELENMMSRR